MNPCRPGPRELLAEGVIFNGHQPAQALEEVFDESRLFASLNTRSIDYFSGSADPPVGTPLITQRSGLVTQGVGARIR